MTDWPQVICKRCRKPLVYLGERNEVLYYEGCPKHPNNRRPGDRTVSFADAAKDGSIGIDRSALEAARRVYPV
jgi:hypothetical protein